MGYSPCKMVKLNQKLKMPKRCQKQLYYHIRVVVGNSQHESTLKITKIMQNAWAIAQAKRSVWVKN